MKKIIRKLLYPFSYTCSQAGQDHWVMCEVHNEKKNGFFVDIGAHDGIEISNTYLLEKRLGWDGLCIEANPETFTQLARNRGVRCVHACVDSSEAPLTFLKRGMSGGIVAEDTDNPTSSIAGQTISIDGKSLSRILDENKAPAVIDYLSIDVEGAEDRVLLDFDFSRYVFLSITIERPSEALRSKLAENKYHLIKEIPDLDCFYLHDSIVSEYRARMVAFYGKKFIRIRWR
ncbi:MAG: FkbM family methyltransferase [Verrucomicrobiaceae bacterium]|nr:MAG: FkbM family methyltransferase [Verrucomicrobiaceae bacterium]